MAASKKLGFNAKDATENERVVRMVNAADIVYNGTIASDGEESENILSAANLPKCGHDIPTYLSNFGRCSRFHYTFHGLYLL